MYNDTIKLLNLEQFKLNILKLDVSKINNVLYCYITLERKETICPLCGGKNYNIKDYQTKKITHSISNNNPCIIVYKARRYKCKHCNHVFYEHNPFSLKSNKNSTYTIYTVLEKLKSHTKTFTDVANDLFLSTSTVIRIFDQYVDFKRPTLPQIICFDEIYFSRKLKDKYAFVMADFSKNKILDIQHSRKKNKLSKYFSDISKAERDNVKYIVIDMWDTYLDLAYIYFYNAKIAIDSFHVIKHLNQAIISIRIKIMKLYDKDTDTLQSNDMYYYMLKKFHYFFTRNFDDIYSGPILIGKINSKWDKHEIRKYLLSINTDLDYAYYLKERYREFNLTAEYETCDEEFDELINEFLDSHLEEFRDFGQLLLRWKPYIKNSFLRVNGRRLSNGPIEGINSRIKTIIKSANGFKNFRRFRNRTIYSINKNVPIKYKPIKINNIKK